MDNFGNEFVGVVENPHNNAQEPTQAEEAKPKKWGRRKKAFTEAEAKELWDTLPLLHMLKGIDGISANSAYVFSLVPYFGLDNTDAFKNAAEFFGGEFKLRNYLTSDEFEKDLKKLQNLGRIIAGIKPVQNEYKLNFGRNGSQKLVMSIGGKVYSVNKGFREAITGLPADEQKSLLLSHKDTIENDSIETL